MPIYEFRCRTHGDFDEFRKMAQASDDAMCPECGAKATRRFTIPAVKIKAGREKPGDSVKRITGEKRKHADIPWPNAKTGQCERVYLDSGSKAEQKSRIQDAVLRTKLAQRRKLTRADIQPANL